LFVATRIRCYNQVCPEFIVSRSCLRHSVFQSCGLAYGPVDLTPAPFSFCHPPHH
jgi:hypothetical protein